MSSSSLSTGDVILAVTHLPLVEVVCAILLSYSAWAAGDCKKEDENARAKTTDKGVRTNLFWIRVFASLFCMGFFLKWLLFFWVFPGRIMPLKGKKDLGNEAALIVFVIGDWFRYSMLPAGTLCVILHLLNAYQQLHGTTLNPYLKNSIIGIFVGAMIFRFVFQYQTATNVKVIDVCFRPMTCNPMWFISLCLTAWILWKAKKATEMLDKGTLSKDHERKQTLLFRKLWAMVIGCFIAVTGRTIQLMGCEAPHTIESNFTYRVVKRIATWSVLITQVIVSWHSFSPSSQKKTDVEPSSRGSRLIRVHSGANSPTASKSTNPTVQLGSYLNSSQEMDRSDDETYQPAEASFQPSASEQEESGASSNKSGGSRGSGH